MKIEIKDEQEKRFLKPDTILRYLITDDLDIEVMIMCKGEKMNLITTDKDVYEALGSIKPYDNFKLNKLVKFFEVVNITSYEDITKNKKPILKESRVEELRKLALKKRD